MAVKRVVRVFDDEQASSTMTPGSVLGSIQTKSADQWRYLVTLDTAGSCAEARDAEGVEALGFQHPDDDSLLLTRKSATRAGENPTNSEWYFWVVCSFDSSLTDAFNNGEEDEPFNVEIHVTTEAIDAPTNIATAMKAGDYATSPPARPADGTLVLGTNKAVTNSAGDLFEPMPMKRTRNQRITFTFQTRDLSILNAVDDLLGTVNTDSVTITQLGWSLVAGQLLCDDAGYGYDPETKIYTVSFTVVYNPLGWYLRLVDQGYYYWQTEEDDSKTRLRFKDGSSLDQMTQGYLDGSGGKLDIDPTDPEPVMRSFWMDWGAAFSDVISRLDQV